MSPRWRTRGRLLINCVPKREQRTAKLTLNSVFDILNFTVASQKITLSNVVNYNAYSLTSATFCKICKKNNIPFSYKNSIFPTLNDDSAAHCPARKKYPFSSFLFTHRYTTDQKAPPLPPDGEPSRTVNCRFLHAIPPSPNE